MRLPEELSQAIEREVERIDRRRLMQAAAQLTAQYQSASFSAPAMASEALRVAYLAIRLPATYAAVLAVFEEVLRLAPNVSIGSLLDLGAGPGTALHATAQVFPSLTQATAIEGDMALADLGRRLCAEIPHDAVRNARWLLQDLQSGPPSGEHDLVVMSYVLGELSSLAMNRLLAGAWDATREFLVILEPGTKRGFGIAHSAREWLISQGAHLLAPCPHTQACPMAGAGDWCHFSARVERTSLHRQLKEGTLGHEDEKFSYIVASRRPLAPVPARIVRHPQKHSGHVRLTLCTPQRIETRTVTKSQKEKYRQARKAEWGDAWES